MNYSKLMILPMSGDDNLSAFLNGFGFDEEELIAVSDELDSLRTIPGTTVERYINRVIKQGLEPWTITISLVGEALRACQIRPAQDLAKVRQYDTI